VRRGGSRRISPELRPPAAPVPIPIPFPIPIPMAAVTFNGSNRASGSNSATGSERVTGSDRVSDGGSVRPWATAVASPPASASAPDPDPDECEALAPNTHRTASLPPSLSVSVTATIGIGIEAAADDVRRPTGRPLGMTAPGNIRVRQDGHRCRATAARHIVNAATRRSEVADPDCTVLVVDDEEAIRTVLEARLSSWGYDTLLAATADDAARIVDQAAPDIVVSDVVLPGASGLDLLRRLKAGDPSRPVILITGHGSIDDAVEAMKLGADDFLTKPIEPAQLEAVLAAASDRVADRRSASILDAELDAGRGPGGMVGASEAMRELCRIVQRVAPSDAAVFIAGESGTGKEMVARAVHELSARAAGAFLAVNASAVTETLAESLLFGHEKGAFTGADRRRPGVFEQADGGTLFLDEITEMPNVLQPKLLRALETGIVRRVGGDAEIPVDVRVVAATNRDPLEAVQDGRLREDLFYRLSVFPVSIPPLRERPDDIPLLAHHFIHFFNLKHGAEVQGVTDAARQRLLEHGWPGNVRELRNAVERGVILAGRGLLDVSHLPAFLASVRRREADGVVVPRDATVADAERLLILDTLERVDGNKAAAARRLGIDVKTLRTKIKRYRDEGRAP